MTIIERFRLRVFCRKLDAAIADETQRRIPDIIRLNRMKKLRLLLKDKLFGHTSGPAI